MSAVKKKGRPRSTEAREVMQKVISFRADEETQDALAKVIELIRGNMPMGVAFGSIQAAAIRYAILFTARELSGSITRFSESSKKT